MLTLKEKLIYSCGNIGVAMNMAIHMLFLVFIFTPSDTARLDYHIPQNSIFLGLTVTGIIIFISRIFDAFTDPYIANLSDRSKNRNGKRIPFMRKFALPMGIAYVAVFFIPVVGSISYLNVIWVFVWMMLSAVFLTLYAVPYTTLLVTIAKTPEEKIDLGTYAGLFWFLGFLMVAFSSGGWEVFETMFNITRLESIQLTFCIIAVVSILFMSIPAYFIKETDYLTADNEGGALKKSVTLKESISVVFANKNYMKFFFANTVYNVATFMFETGLIYYITVLALQSESVLGPLTSAMGVLTIACYPFINLFSKKKGKKPVMMIGFALFAISFLTVSVLGLGDIDPWFLLAALVLLSPFSQAAFGILPAVITADCAAQDLHDTNIDKSGMYIAATGFAQKLGGSIATIIFTSLLLFGKDVGDDFGIRLIAVAGIVLVMLGMVIISRYDEKSVLEHAKESV